MLHLVGIIIAFIVIILLIRKQFNFGLSLMLGALIIGIFSLQTIELIDIPKAFIEASIYSFEDQQLFTDTIELALLMTLIYILARCMQETGAIKQVINSLRTFFTKGGTLAVIPAVYGLMPVPGGALFSAPMIDEEGNKHHLDNNQKNFLNVWFRHIWFPIYPVSSAMILICSAEFSNIDIYSLILVNIPSFLAMIGIGLIVLKRFVRHNHREQTQKAKKDASGLIYLIPPLIPLLFYAALQFFGVPQIRSFLIGVFVSILLVFLLTHLSKEEYIQVIKKSLSVKLALAIFGIMIFREMFEVSGASMLLSTIIGELPFPALFIVILTPLVLGVFTGYNLAAIALSYFLVAPFFPLTGLNMVGITSLIFMGAFVGYLVSPIHLCNVLSSDYLKTDTTQMYRQYIPAVLCLLAVQTLFLVLVFHV
ncbi:MAG: DUF401 family protein [Candidatus Thermoplasmatota archaeon]|nr:DUF401 family protein [Candidatus Thermoplasmatota archaeon]